MRQYCDRMYCSLCHVSQLVCLSATRLRCAKTAKLIEVLFGWKLLEAQSTFYYMAVGGPDFLHRGRAELGIILPTAHEHCFYSLLWENYSKRQHQT